MVNGKAMLIKILKICNKLHPITHWLTYGLTILQKAHLKQFSCYAVNIIYNISTSAPS